MVYLVFIYKLICIYRITYIWCVLFYVYYYTNILICFHILKSLHYAIIILSYYHIIILLHYYIIILVCYYIIILWYHYIIILYCYMFTISYYYYTIIELLLVSVSLLLLLYCSCNFTCSPMWASHKPGQRNMLYIRWAKSCEMVDPQVTMAFATNMA